MPERSNPNHGNVQRIQESTFTKGGLNPNTMTPRPNPPAAQVPAQVITGVVQGQVTGKTSQNSGPSNSQ